MEGLVFLQTERKNQIKNHEKKKRIASVAKTKSVT